VTPLDASPSAKADVPSDQSAESGVPSAPAAAVPASRPEHPDRYFLAGPHSRFREVLLLGRAVRDFIKGFRVLHFVGPCVTIFGSARFGESHKYYAIARQLGQRVCQRGFTVMTGGGPGLMEAANRGAQDVSGRSVGCNIELPQEQAPNPYLDHYVTCHYFFVR